MKKTLNTSHSRRSGSTLTEVLIAVMVLGVGAVSVMTLFPVATFRAIKSNQLTQSTIARYHAETAAGAYDFGFYELFFGRNRRPGDGNVLAPFPYWEPGPNGQIGATPPDADDFPRFDINLFNPRRYTLNQFNSFTTAAGTDDDFDSILIDPLGYYRRGGDVAPNSNAARLFGSFEPEVNNPPAGEPQERPLVLPRVTGGHRGNNSNSGIGHRLTEAQARALVTLPDQFSTLIDAQITAINGYNSVDLNNKTDAMIMDDIAGFVDSGNLIKVALVDPDGRVHMRNVNGTAPAAPLVASGGRTVGFTPALPDDPANPGNAVPIERAIVQQQNSDFTWMISARVALPVDVSMDVVVFFKRAYSEADERLFYTRILDTSDPNAGGGIESIFNKAKVYYTGDKPYAREGGYLFDAQNNRWYRILEISAEDETSNPKTMELLLDRQVLDDDGNVAADGTYGITSAFPRGVIDVFPIGKKTSVYNANPTP